MKKPETKAVAKTEKSKLPSALAGRMKKDAGKGVSKAQEDNLVPLIYVLQEASPQARKKDPAYMPGAEAGMIWLRNAAEPFVDGEKGIWFQPCHFAKEWVEWVPRKKGGGIVNRHKEKPANAELQENDEGNEVWTLPNGNECVETRYHSGFVIAEDGTAMPYIIPLKGSGHSFSKKWMFMQNSKTVDGETAPSWACLYLLKTLYRSKSDNSWHMLEVDDADTRWIETDEEYDRGLKLHEAFASGEKQPDVDTLDAAEPVDDGKSSGSRRAAKEI